MKWLGKKSLVYRVVSLRQCFVVVFFARFHICEVLVTCKIASKLEYMEKKTYFSIFDALLLYCSGRGTKIVGTSVFSFEVAIAKIDAHTNEAQFLKVMTFSQKKI